MELSAERMYRLSVCTSPLYSPRTTPDHIRILELSLPSTELFRVKTLPFELWKPILVHSAPYPELAAIGQTPNVLSQIPQLAPTDAAMFVRLEGQLYLTMIQFQGRDYV